MSKYRIAICGATGYAGEELIRILQQHPFVQVTHLAASAKWERPVPLAEVFPQFAGALDLPVNSLDPEKLPQLCDAAFLALPHGVSMDIVPILLKEGRKVVDLGGDFRLKDAAAFAKWYGKTHGHPELLNEAVYGIPELSNDEIRSAQLTSNPGCYATSVILAAAPVLKAGLIEPDSIIVDAKSGRTGAGRERVSSWKNAGKDQDMWPYKVDAHQHIPEVEQALSNFAREGMPRITFVPHVVPLDRGIISTIYMRTKKGLSWKEVNEFFNECYPEKKAPFIGIHREGEWPEVRKVVGSNRCELAFLPDKEKRLLIVVAAIDNLIKGAAGQAVQNMNLMLGLPETAGLLS